MKRLLKILVGVVAAVVLLTVGLSVFVHFYLTDERVKKLVVPRLENALAREVKLEDIGVSLLKGVSLQNFVILEADGEKEFVKVDSFDLSYDLLPLLRKQLKISRIVLNEPRIRVVRYENGKFNFETLKPLTAPPADEKTEAPVESGEAVLPLALTVNEIKINNAALTVQDELKEIPEVKAGADCIVSLKTGYDPASMEYSGVLELKAEAIHQAVTVSLEGDTAFDRNKADFNFDLLVEDQKMNLSGTVEDYLKIPDITCDAESQSFDIDYLLAGLSSAGEVEKENQVTDGNGTSDESEDEVGTEKQGQPIGAGLPAGLKAQGRVRVEKAKYGNLWINDFRLDYELRDNFLKLKDISAYTAEGRVTSQASLDLNKLEPDYNATLAIQGVQFDSLQRDLFPKAGERISGNLDADLKLSGAGFQWPALADRLNGEGTYELIHGRINQMEIFSAIADLLREEGLKDIYFDDLSGNFRMEDGDVMLKAALEGDEVNIKSEGIVGLDGKLAMPLELELSPELSARLASGSASKYLMQENGMAKLNLYLTGSVTDPQVSLDTASARERIKKELTDTIREKAGKEIEKALGRDKRGKDEASPEEVVDEFIKGILGK